MVQADHSRLLNNKPITAARRGPLHCGLGIGAGVYFTLAMALKCYPLQPGGLLAFLKASCLA